MSIVGVVLYGYGIGAVLGIVPGRGFIIGIYVYVFMAIGAVLFSLTGLVALVRHLRTDLEPLTVTEAGATAAGAPVIAAAMTALVTTGPIFWVFLGQAILSLSFFLGFVSPRPRRYLVLVASTLAVAGLIAGVVLGTRMWVNSLVFLTAGGSFLFLLFGGSFFLLGSRLNALPVGSSAE